MMREKKKPVPGRESGQRQERKRKAINKAYHHAERMSSPGGGGNG